MIGWLIDRWWAWKNRDELAELDQQIAGMEAMRAHLDRRMEQTFGPDWRAEGERRLAERMGVRFTVG